MVKKLEVALFSVMLAACIILLIYANHFKSLLTYLLDMQVGLAVIANLVSDGINIDYVTVTGTVVHTVVPFAVVLPTVLVIMNIVGLVGGVRSIAGENKWLK